MPQSIPSGLTKEAVLQVLADLDAGIDHPFGQPTGYELVHEGKRYAPKAVIGLAFRHVLGRILQPDEFSGGEAPGQANHVLRQLGFTVVKKDEQPEEADERTGKDWSEQEVRLIIDDYFAMLEKELLGKPYSKTEHRKALAPQLPGRSKSSLEYKHQNISAALLNLGLPSIDGYKPAKNLQSLLAKEVEAHLDRDPAYLQRLLNAPLLNLVKEPTTEGVTLEEIREDPPEGLLPPTQSSTPWLSRKARRINFAEREAANRQLGTMGERFVVSLERQRLVGIGRDDLAAKVDHVAETIGDGLGFDVLSFETDESEKLVEVKTTVCVKDFPFFVTETEVRCSEAMGQQFHLFRLFDFARSPRLYVLTGSLRQACRLEALLYRASM